jgi:hypothetical protein
MPPHPFTTSYQDKLKKTYASQDAQEDCLPMTRRSFASSRSQLGGVAADSDSDFVSAFVPEVVENPSAFPLGCDSATFQPCSDRAPSSLKVLGDEFEKDLSDHCESPS